MYVILFSIIAAAATMIGGSIPLLHKKLTKETLTLLVAFSAGVLLSTGLNHMVAESYAETGRWAMVAVSLGFMLLYGYEKVAMIHACREQDCRVHPFRGAALAGIGFHSLLDGFAIAVSFELEKTLGMIVIAAVILHRLPTGLSIASIMLSHHYQERKAWLALSVIAGLNVVGAVIGQLMPFDGTIYLSLGVGLSGGTFLYISTSDLLPMAHENHHDYRVPASFLIGFLGVLAATFLNGG
ncbi:MAG TPA: ZIP family metal transporter [bacterium]